MSTRLASKLQIVGSVHQAVRLVCANRIQFDENVCAYVSGIRVGSNHIEGAFEPGDIIEYPIYYLPSVDLPNDIRFVSERTGLEIAEPFRIESHDSAIALIGMGEAVVQNVAIDQGMIRGLVVNRVNGMLRPQMFARINGIIPRAITIGQPRQLDDGGASFQFSAQLHPADLGENGLTAEIFLLGQDAPLTSVAFRRADVDDLTKRIVQFEAQLAQVSQSSALRFKTINHELKGSLNIMQQRIDSFIEYAASFMFDRIAASEVQTLPDAAPLAPALQAKVDAFQSILRGDNPHQTPLINRREKTITVPLESRSFSFGWHQVESEGQTSFRRMADNAVIINPYPDRPIVEVRLTVLASDASAQPSICAAFDGTSAVCTVERAKRKNARWRVRIGPAANETALTSRALSIVNLMPVSAEPRQDTTRTDDVLSVVELTFVYAD